MLISQHGVLARTDIFPSLFADNRGTWGLRPSGGNFEVWRKMQLPNDEQLSSCLWQDHLPLLLLPTAPGPALPWFPPLLPLQVLSIPMGLMPWCLPFCVDAFLHLSSCPPPTVLTSAHIPSLPPYSPAFTTAALLFISP